MWNVPGADGVFAPGFDYLGNPRYSLTANDTVCVSASDCVVHLEMTCMCFSCGPESERRGKRSLYVECNERAACAERAKEREREREREK